MELNELRKQRDYYESKMREIQKEIDDLTMSKYGLDKYLNKYISLDDVIVYVKGFRRQVDGVNANGIIIDLSYNELEITPDGWTYIHEDDLDDIEVMTKEEVLDKINNYIKNFVK